MFDGYTDIESAKKYIEEKNVQPLFQEIIEQLVNKRLESVERESTRYFATKTVSRISRFVASLVVGSAGIFQANIKVYVPSLIGCGDEELAADVIAPLTDAPLVDLQPTITLSAPTQVAEIQDKKSKPKAKATKTKGKEDESKDPRPNTPQNATQQGNIEGQESINAPIATYIEPKYASASQVVEEVNKIIAPKLVGQIVTELLEMDNIIAQLIAKEHITAPTPGQSNTNTDLPFINLVSIPSASISSLAVASAGSWRSRIPLHQFLSQKFHSQRSLPKPQCLFFYNQDVIPGSSLSQTGQIGDNKQDQKKETKLKEGKGKEQQIVSENKSNLKAMLLSFGDSINPAEQLPIPSLPGAIVLPINPDTNAQQQLQTQIVSGDRPTSGKDKKGQKKKDKIDPKDGVTAQPQLKDTPIKKQTTVQPVIQEEGIIQGEQLYVVDGEKDIQIEKPKETLKLATPPEESTIIQQKLSTSLFQSFLNGISRVLDVKGIPGSTSSSIVARVPGFPFSQLPFEEIFSVIEDGGRESFATISSQIYSRIINNKVPFPVSLTVDVSADIIFVPGINGFVISGSKVSSIDEVAAQFKDWIHMKKLVEIQSRQTDTSISPDQQPQNSFSLKVTQLHTPLPLPPLEQAYNVTSDTPLPFANMWRKILSLDIQPLTSASLTQYSSIPLYPFVPPNNQTLYILLFAQFIASQQPPITEEQPNSLYSALIEAVSSLGPNISSALNQIALEGGELEFGDPQSLFAIQPPEPEKVESPPLHRFGIEPSVLYFSLHEFGTLTDLFNTIQRIREERKRRVIGIRYEVERLKQLREDWEQKEQQERERIEKDRIQREKEEAEREEQQKGEEDKDKQQKSKQVTDKKGTGKSGGKSGDKEEKKEEKVVKKEEKKKDDKKKDDKKDDKKKKGEKKEVVQIEEEVDPFQFEYREECLTRYLLVLLRNNENVQIELVTGASNITPLDADVAVSLGVQSIRLPLPTTSAGAAKLNRLVEIEDELEAESKKQKK